MKLKFKIYFFFQYFPFGIFGPYLAVYLNQRNFTGAQIGLLLGVMPISMLLFQMVWSYLSDILNTRRTLLLIGSFSAAIAAYGLGKAETFSFALMWAILFSAMRAPIAPISNAIVLDYLEDLDEMDAYSLFRLWGSAAFAVSSALMGALFLNRILDYFSWFLMGVYLILTVLGFLLPERGKEFSYKGFEGLQMLTQNPNFVLYLFGSMFVGATLGIYNSYQTLFLQLLDASSWLIGFTVSLQALVEVPMMMAVPFLLNRFSTRGLILVGAIALPIRWLLYTVIQQPGWVIPTQIFHGLGVVSFLVVGVAFIDRLISPKWRATGQGLYLSAMLGIGSGVGTYLAGLILEGRGVRSIWYLSLALGLVGLGLVLITFKRIGRDV